MKKYVCILFFSLGLLKAQEFPNNLNVDEAISFALENNTEIINAKLEVDKAYKEKWKTISIGLPQVKASFDYTNFLELPVSLIPAQFFGGQEGDFAEVSFGTEQNLVGSARISQMIFDGSYIVGVKATKTYLKVSDNALQKTNLNVRRSVNNAYLNTLLSKENIDFIDKNIKNLEGTLRETKKLFKNGFIEEESVEQLKITLSELKSKRKFAYQFSLLSKDILKISLGYEEEDELNLTSSLESIINSQVFEVPVIESWDINSNIDVKIANNNVEFKRLEYKLEQSKSLPTLSTFISGAYTGNNNSFSFNKQNQKWFGSALFGVSLEVPLFSSFGRSASSQMAKISYQQSKKILEKTQREIKVSAKNAKANYELAIDDFYVSKNNMNLAERIERKNQIKFSQGMANSFELRQAQSQLYKTQKNYLDAVQKLVSKKIELKTILNITNN
ncbi:MAG: outer membrane protein TolC [Candidatus Marivariicella framensis]|jgi:outer membrane protein TolC|tara:strand:+ start:2612 stop:3949 length:1338 start_codon:yes stop_codon:yes gene_type:complete